MTEKDYKRTDKIKRICEQLKHPEMLPSEQQLLIKDGFGALRTCYEAFVMFDLFGEVVIRFAERISIDRLKNVVIDIGIRDEVISKVGLLSRYIEGHSHSDAFAAQLPTPDMLKHELDEFEQLRKRHKDFKKANNIDG